LAFVLPEVLETGPRPHGGKSADEDGDGRLVTSEALGSALLEPVSAVVGRDDVKVKGSNRCQSHWMKMICRSNKLVDGVV
jgi:hypothetical protein